MLDRIQHFIIVARTSNNSKSMNRFFSATAFVITLFPYLLWGQTNDKLQIHFMNVGQGDGALLVSPKGETILFDDGVRNDCDRVIAYLQQLGITKIDYHINSHYHDDHLGCIVPVLQEFPLQKQAFDRGGSYASATFRNYTNFVGSLRKTAIEGSTLTLDQGSSNPVKIEFVALNGNGIRTDNENDLSLVCVIRFGQFDALIGGDLSGYKKQDYLDIETSVAPKVGQVEVYKVNHHGSSFSSNPTWLETIAPKIGIISCGYKNSFKHPKSDCLSRLHSMNIMTYWTESGNGVAPVAGLDTVGNNIIVESAPNATTFSVTYSGNQTNIYSVWNPVNAASTSFAWSKKSSVYHFANCKYVDSISPNNLESNSVAPADKTLHSGCPKL